MTNEDVGDNNVGIEMAEPVVRQEDVANPFSYDTEEYDSSDYDSLDEEEEDDDFEVRRNKSTWPIFNPKCNWHTFKPVEGLRFTGPKQMKNYFKTYAFVNSRGICFPRQTKDRVQVRCRPNCPFYVWASWMKAEKSFQIKTLRDKHECGKDVSVRIANSVFIANLYHEQILANPHWKLSDMKTAVLHKYGQDVSKTKCYRAKKIALGDVDKKLRQHYKRLRDYGEEIKRSNPGTTVVITTDRNTPEDPCIFKRMYVCFEALKRNWREGCRPVVGLDGCFLKGFCKGQLLADVGRDGNNNMFPVAWAVVEGENNDSWNWFVDLLKKDLGYNDGGGLTIISDQHKGLVEAIAGLLAAAEHRNCVRHIYANMRKILTGEEGKEYFWRASKSSHENYYKKAMADLMGLSEEAYQYCILQKPKAWSRAFFQMWSCCDSVDNNMSETFNGVIIEARSKPIIAMLEDITLYCMGRLHRKKAEIQKMKDDICPRVRAKLEKSKENFRWYDCNYNGDYKFEIRNSSMDSYVVNLRERSCTCRMRSLSGIPCAHAVSAIYYLNEKPEDYVASWLTKEGALKCYQHFMQPMNGMSLWPTAEEGCLEDLRRQEGRTFTRKKNGRIRKTGVRGKCGTCGIVGHNARSCKGIAVEEVASNATPRGSTRSGADSGASQSRPKKTATTIDNSNIIGGAEPRADQGAAQARVKKTKNPPTPRAKSNISGGAAQPTTKKLRKEPFVKNPSGKATKNSTLSNVANTQASGVDQTISSNSAISIANTGAKKKNTPFKSLISSNTTSVTKKTT